MKRIVFRLCTRIRVLPRYDRTRQWKFLRCRRIHRYGRTTVLSTQWSRPAMGSCLRWLFTHGRAAVHDCLSLSSCADERRTDHMAILPPTLHPHRTTIFHLHDTIQYPANVMGAAKWRNLLKRSVTDIPELPDTGRTPVVHVPSDQPLLIHTHNIAMAEKATAKEERFFIGLFLLSTCIPYLNRWCGEVWGQCFGTNTICCGTSQVTWAILYWHITYMSISLGTVPNVSL